MRRVLFDCGFLSLLLHPAAKVPNDPKTGAPVERPRERIDYLLSTLDHDGAQIIIPAPMLAEFLVRADEAGPAYLSELNTNATFRVEPFDQIAAIECARLDERARAAGNKKGSSTEPWQKVKVDRQIVAIAVVHQADCVYTDDAGIAALCGDINLSVVRTSELPLPPLKPEQMMLEETVDAAGTAVTVQAAVSTEQKQPASQSPDDEKPKATQPEPARPSSPPVVQEPQQPGSSLTAAPPPPSEK